MGNKGSNTTTQNTTTAPNPQAMQAYSDLLTRAQGVAQTPYQAYGGELVAGVNAQQNQGIGGINQYANAAQPAINYGIGQAATSSAPLTQAGIQRYMDPYVQNVVNATQAQFNNQNQQQQQGVVGNAIAQGALGGNRSAIAQSELANQQQLAQAPVIANLYNQGYGQAVNTATQQQGIGLQGAGLLGNLGVAGQQAGLAGAGAQIGAVSLQQNTQQQLDAALMQQFQRQQAYPYQQTQWLAGLDTGVGSQMGGTSSGQTTAPAPNQTAQWLGTGIAAAGLFLNKGGRVNSYNNGGVVGYAPGGVVPGMPWGDTQGWIPQSNIVHGPGAPPARAPAPYNSPQQDLSKQAAGIGDLAKKIKDATSGDNPLPYGADISGASGPTSVGGAPLQGVYNPYYGGGNSGSGDAYGGNASQPLAGLDAGDYGAMARGGVASYADGGATLSDMVSRGRTLLDKDRDDSARFAARMNAGVAPPENMTHRNIVDYLRKPINGYATGGSPDNSDSDVINPDEPYRLAGSDAMDSWRAGVDHPNAAIVADQNVVPEKSDGIAPHHSSFTRESTSDGSLPPEVASGYSDSGFRGIAPPSVRAANESRAGVSVSDGRRPIIDFGQGSHLGPSLLSAGFGMLASRSPFLGNAIGEGGLAGVASYNAQLKAEQDARQHAEQLQLERDRLEKPYQEMTVAQQSADKRAAEAAKISQANEPIIIGPNDKPIVNPAYIKMKEETEKSFKPTWGKIDETEGGRDVMGWVDPNTKQVFDAAGKPYIPRNPAYAIPPTPPGAQPGPQSSVTPPAPDVPSSPANASAGTESPYKVASLSWVPPAVQQPSNAVPFDPAKPVPPASMDSPNTPTPPPQPPPSLPPHAPDPQAPEGSDASRDTAMLARIAQEDPGVALAIKKAADYDLDPAKYASMRRDHREKFVNMVLRYDPNYRPQDVGLRYKAQAAFLPGTKTGDTVRAFNTAVSHLDTLKAAYRAVQNGDWQTFNSLKNRFQAEFGYAPPNTLNAIAQIVGGEVVKATVGAQNALGDREELRKALEPKLSQGQALDVIDHFQQLMGGQLHSLKFAYEQGTHLHNFDEKYLLPRSREVLKQIDAEGAGGSAATMAPQDKQALDWANANPNDPRSAAIKKKLGI